MEKYLKENDDYLCNLNFEVKPQRHLVHPIFLVLYPDEEKKLT